MSDSDEILLKNFPSAPNEVFEQLLSRYEKLIYHIAYRYFNHPQDACDMTQEAAINIYRGLSRVALREGGTLKSWICTVTAHTCLDALRKRRVETTPMPETGVLDEVFNLTTPSAEDAAEAKERTAEIAAAIAKLPLEWRTLIILRETQGFSYQELSEATGVGVSTIKSRLSRARAALRDLLR